MTQFHFTLTVFGLATTLWWVAAHLQHPHPISSLTLLLGGGLGYLATNRWRFASAAGGALTGWAAGIAIHAWQHAAQGHGHHHEHSFHAYQDALLGFGIGAAALVITILFAEARRRRALTSTNKSQSVE
ncbi:MAG: hypothetical protein AB7N71_01960 [Phycisphaerae bacterium]